MGSSKNQSANSNYAYTLGPTGNKLTVAELSGRAVAYAYDSLYRLTSETVTGDPSGKNGLVGYTLDAVGNRKTLNATLPPAGGISYTYDADDRLGSDNYDASGNTINSGGIANTYDFENHLITHGGATVVYDGDGNRVSETVAGVTTNYLIDTQNPTGYAQVVDELQSSTVARTYAYGLQRINENQVLNSAWTASFYLYDGHGSVRQLTNSAGAVTDTYDFDAFGNLIDQTGTTPNNYLFAGEQYDPALGLYYNRARYLNTATGRFWSADTEEGQDEQPLTLHKYLYADADPVDGADPSGFQDNLTEVSAELSIMNTINTMPVLLVGKPQNKNVQITIDDAPGTSNADMLGILDSFGIKTMFFIEGEFAQWRPDDVRNIVKHGQQLGNHTWDHPNLTHLKDADIVSEFARTDRVVREITGKSMVPNWRPPYGASSGSVEAAAAKVGFTKKWLWDVDSLDWKYRSDTDKIVDQVEKGLRGCGKQTCDILFHDKDTTVDALQVIMPRLKLEGYKFVNFP